MSDTRLEKVNERLYHEPYKEGRPFKWAKCLEPLFITLRNVRVSRGLSIERPETSFSRLWKDIVGEEKARTLAGDEPEEKYSERFGWRVTGTGHLDERIGLIRKDGTLTGFSEHFDRVDVILWPIPTNVSDTDKERALGSLFYDDADLIVELPVPASPLEQLCHELVSGRLSKLTVGVFVDVFQSEVDRSLAEPGMQTYYIEEESISNGAYLSSLDAHRDIPKTRASGADDIEDLDLEIETPEEFAEKYTRQKSGTQKFFESLGAILVAAGAVIAIWQFYDDPAQLPVPFLLAGIGFLLFMLVVYAEGILVDLEYLQRIVKERRKKGQ